VRVCEPGAVQRGNVRYVSHSESIFEFVPVTFARAFVTRQDRYELPTMLDVLSKAAHPMSPSSRLYTLKRYESPGKSSLG